MNITSTSLKLEKQLADLFHLLRQPVRIHLLLAIGRREVCVCHLEALLQQRQAFISQNLMQLRRAGVVSSRREGRNQYYRLTDLRLLDLLEVAAELLDQGELFASAGSGTPIHGCPCPDCSPIPAPACSLENPFHSKTVQFYEA